jgi:hypothetical protein
MKEILLVILTAISTQIFGQTDNDYIAYYNLTNEGDKQVYLKNDSLAYDCYLKAFEKVDYIHSRKLIIGAELAAKLNDYKNIYEFSKGAIIQGVETKFYKNKEFKKYRKTDLFKTFKDSLKYFKAEYEKNLNSDYKKQIDSLYYVDQRIIRNNKSVKGKYNIDKSKLPEKIFDLDSLIFADILVLIEKYGFATERNVGKESFSKMWIFYHHNIRLPKNEKYIELAQRALKEGAYLPDQYAWMFDQSRTFKKEEPYFYFGVVFTGDLKTEKKEEIDKRRKEWGIKPLEAQKTIQRKNSLIQKNLW